METLLTFALASTLLSLAPGPDNLFVLMQSALYGPRAGVLVTLGLCTGLIGHTLLVALGVAALFQASLIAFNLLKFAGAAYLLYLAWQAWKAGPGEAADGNASTLGGASLYRRGIIMNLSNPKVAIFFLAFLPQFTNPENGNISLQIIVLGLIFMAVALLVFSLIALLAGKLSGLFNSSAGFRLGLNRLASVVLGALAVRLALSSQ